MAYRKKTESGTVEQTRIPGDVALSVGECAMPTPSGWRWVELSSVARLESGHTPKKARPEYWDGDVPWIGIPDARENHGKTIQSTQRNVTQEGIEKSSARVLPARTVVLSRTASIGYVTVMGHAMATSQDFVNWVCSDALDPYFLMYLFQAEGGALRRFSKGSTHSTIYFSEAEAFQVCLPNVRMQRKIVAALDAWFTRVNRLEQLLGCLPELISQLRRSTLLSAFRGLLVREQGTEERGFESGPRGKSPASVESLKECVEEVGGAVSAQSLLRATDGSTGSAHAFYSLLRDAVEEGLLRVVRAPNGQSQIIKVTK